MLSYHPIFFAVAAAAAPAPSPQAALDELLAADRAFSAGSAAASDVATGLAPMIDKDAAMPVPGEGIVVGRDAILASMRKIPSFKEGHAQWAPVRGGISADGTQGFTYGFLTLSAGDEARRNRKYLAYWIRRPEGWRVVAYRQQVREPGDVSTAMIAPSLPARAVAPVEDAKMIEGHQLSVAAAEKAFSDRAQVIGLRNAFREYGREDAMNMYSGAGFAVGLDAVTANFKEGEPTTIHWSTEKSFAASSGDLGVSIGTIVPNTPAADGSSNGFPFFTVWRRDAPDQPWRYIAE